VLILGPRQCGKTTLAKHFVRGRYFDLEKPSDVQVFAGDIEFALRRFSEPVILDEARVLHHSRPLRHLFQGETKRLHAFVRQRFSQAPDAFEDAGCLLVIGGDHQGAIGFRPDLGGQMGAAGLALAQDFCPFRESHDRIGFEDFHDLFVYGFAVHNE
jgi:hypothetical protein